MHFQPIEHMGDDAYLTHSDGVATQDMAQQLSVEAVYDPLDDVFGSEDASPSVPSLERPNSSQHPSDMRRLETEHTTAGYREGVTIAKEKTVQAGFDEGFSLGATIGLVAGQILGTLESIHEALKTDEVEEAKIKLLLQEAEEELSVARLFSTDYWAPDGNWTYEVKSVASDEVLFADVAGAHPLIQKWTMVLDSQIKLWKVERSIMDRGQDGPRLEIVGDEPISSFAPTDSRRPLDW